MYKLILIIGGVRSGKSDYAQKLASKSKKPVIYVATGEALDEEMKKRIEKHRKKRADNWKTIEEPKNVDKVILNLKEKKHLILIDCLTLLISNLILANLKEKEILKKVRNLLKVLKDKQFETVIVSNEVGMGVVPAHKLGRNFRDVAGRINQIIAQRADEVYFMISGIPLRIK